MKPKHQSHQHLFVFCVVFGLMHIFMYPQQSRDNPEGKIIKEIRLEGLKRTKEYIVTRELISKVGEPLRQDNLDKESKALMSLDIFSQMSKETIVSGDDVILIYRFTETFPLLPLPAFKITDENGISAGFNLKSSNLLGKNIFFSGGMLFGGTKEYELWIVNPWFTGNHFGYSLEYYRRERDNLITDSFEISNEFYIWIRGRLGERERIGGGFESLNIQSEQPGTTLSSSGHDHTARFSFFAGYDSRDEIPETREGWWTEVALGYDSKLFNSATDFYQLDLDIRRYQPLPFGDRHSLALYSLTTMRTGTIGENVAPWQAFGIGGSSTVRGWEYAARKGKNQFINTVEYRITLLKSRPVKLPFNIDYRIGLGFAVFGDLGIGWDNSNQFKSNNFIGGVGAGIRLLMPVLGMLRFDVAWGQKGQGIFLHIGAFEKPVMTRKRVR
jgi:outer membrane protein insertion porin family